MTVKSHKADFSIRFFRIQTKNQLITTKQTVGEKEKLQNLQSCRQGQSSALDKEKSSPLKNEIFIWLEKFSLSAMT